MASLADELSAAMFSNDEESSKVSNPSITGNNSENNPNVINMSMTNNESCILSGAKNPAKPASFFLDPNKCHIAEGQYQYTCDISNDMDITCDVTIPVMSQMKLADRTNSLEIVNNTAMPVQDIAPDETIAVPEGQSCFDTKDTVPLEPYVSVEDINESLTNTSDMDFNLNATNTRNFSEPYKLSENFCVWSQISTDFDPEEETANFGTRYALEKDGKLFDVFTHATIEPKVKLHLYL